MATNKNITMKQFNGVDYDTLYPKTTISQVEGFNSPLGMWKYIGKINKMFFGVSYADDISEFLTLVDYGDSGGILGEINSIAIKINSINGGSLSKVYSLVCKKEFIDGSVSYGSGITLWNGDGSSGGYAEYLNGYTLKLTKGKVGNSPNGFTVYYYPSDNGPLTAFIVSFPKSAKIKKLSVAVAYIFSTVTPTSPIDCDIDVYVQTTK